jgi:hypothetical protein
MWQHINIYLPKLIRVLQFCKYPFHGGLHINQALFHHYQIRKQANLQELKVVLL